MLSPYLFNEYKYGVCANTPPPKKKKQKKLSTANCNKEPILLIK